MPFVSKQHRGGSTLHKSPVPFSRLVSSKQNLMFLSQSLVPPLSIFLRLLPLGSLASTSLKTSKGRGEFSAEAKGLAPAVHLATDIATDAKTTAHPFLPFHGVHGWSSQERTTPLSIRALTVVLLNEALKVSSRRHWCFLLSKTLLNLDALPCRRPS